MIEFPHSSKKHEILVVDDDEVLLTAISQTLSLNGYQPTATTSPLQALELIKEQVFSSVLADIRMPEMDGMLLLQKILEFDVELPVILITGHGDVNTAVKAVKNGAYHFLQKPVDKDVILTTLARAIERRTLQYRNRELQKRLKVSEVKVCRFYGLVGNHPDMLNLYGRIEKYAKETDPVLISGETGTGKELVARAIHTLGKDPDTPYLAVNMGALPAEMIESELFGHEKGAFTGAVQKKIGKFEHAGTGTLFLDEICSMPKPLQGKLLRVLEERSFTRLGSNHSISLQARIIAASNHDLLSEIDKGLFRQDLYFRLNVLPIHILPLRERRGDIPLLIKHFWQEYYDNGPGTPQTVTSEFVEDLCSRDWPGNIRELRNIVRRYCVLGSKGDSGEIVSSPTLSVAIDPSSLSLCWKEYMARQEQLYLEEVLRFYNGNVSSAHKMMGISRKSLYEKIKKSGIDLQRFR